MHLLILGSRSGFTGCGKKMVAFYPHIETPC
jgi:hypothetical protein